MARPGFKRYPQGTPLRARRGWLAVLTVDAVVHLLAACWLLVGALQGQFVSKGWGLALALVALAITACAVGCMGLRPTAVNWRRRLALVALLALLWRGGPLAGHRGLVVAGVLWTGLVWIGTLVEGRRVARAVVEATGEEGLGDDPSRHL